MTQLWQQYKGYLSVLLLLILARFIWQPLWQSKQESWQQLQFSETARFKTQSLLTQADSMEQARQDMREILISAEKKLEKASDMTVFKLQTQQQLEQVFAQHSLQITLSSWREGLAEDSIQTLVLDLRFNGKLKQYLELLAQLQESSLYPSLVITEQQLTMRGQSPDSMGNITGSISLRLAVILPEVR
jgi:hypothetical protein